MSCGGNKLTDEVKAMIGMIGEKVECWSPVEPEGLRRFCQALMDPDPRYWDEEFAKTTKFGEIVTPHIYVSYLEKNPPWGPDTITEAFKKNPDSDGIGGVKRRGALPPVPTDLVRILNAGNEIEIYKYPSLGDTISFQSRYSSITERLGRDQAHMLIITIETTFTSHRNELLCITRQATIQR